MSNWLESIALNRVRRRYPEMQRKGFSKAVRLACGFNPSDPDNPEKSYDIGKVPIIPDGWFVRGDYANQDAPEGAEFTCIEVEDKNPLSARKLRLYGCLWDILWDSYHDLRLIVVDRYGLGEREIDLEDVFWST